ncbi:MAG: hypothetical protein IPL87_01215 [Candidatus Moraniibacteriota bacterium]|nr:MAG: hypothetical protein IPL87_01215 [Candidatus Moranbacteria bacterium]
MKKEANEQCDDGNTRNGDGCTAQCILEIETPKPIVVPTLVPQPTPEPTEEPKKEEKHESCDGSLGDFVWNDRNKNGVQDPGEEGLGGVTVKLIHGNRVDKDTTDKNGKYKFDDLCKRNYTVTVDASDVKSCQPTFDKDGKLDHSTNVDLGRDEEYKKADFGYACSAAKSAPRTGAGAVGISLAGALASAAVWGVRRYLPFG